MTVSQLPAQFQNDLPAAFARGGIAVAAPTRSERMQDWLDLFMKTAEVAEVLARTSFVPAGMQGKPAEVAASMMKGFELGMDPLDALANMFVVKGKVGFYAEFMRRRIIKAGHEFYVTDATDSRAVVKGRRRDGDREAEWQQASFSAEQAKKAGIDLGGYPADKLVARATSRLCRRAFPDVLSGAEIVEDIIDGIVETSIVESDRPDVEERPALQRRRQPKRQPPASRPQAAAAGPPPASSVADGIDEFPGDEPAAPPAPAADSEGDPDRPASTAQNRKMHAQFRDINVTERDERLLVSSAILGFTLDSSAALTVAEASKIIDTLQNWLDGHDGNGNAVTVEDQVREILNTAALLAEDTPPTEEE